MRPHLFRSLIFTTVHSPPAISLRSLSCQAPLHALICAQHALRRFFKPNNKMIPGTTIREKNLKSH